MDNTLVGGSNSGIRQLLDILNEQNYRWVIATGRPKSLALEGIAQYNLPVPDALISSVGCEISTGADLELLPDWPSKTPWAESQILDFLAGFEFIGERVDIYQGHQKLAFGGKLNPDQLDQILQAISESSLNIRGIYSHDWYLDVLPEHVNKASAIEHLANLWQVPLKQIVCAGDSNNDRDMLSLPDIRGILVGNHLPEIADLASQPHIYPASTCFAEGIVEGLNFWLNTSGD